MQFNMCEELLREVSRLPLRERRAAFIRLADEVANDLLRTAKTNDITTKAKSALADAESEADPKQKARRM